jgi:NosR/NirI family nitrous oxide reductase transcriptional regulator
VKRAALQLYRLAVLVAIAWTIHQHHLRLRIQGNDPVSLDEVRRIFPAAAELVPDPGERAGLFVRDEKGSPLGYVLRTSPVGDRVVGYRGWTDSLVAFDTAMKVVGVRIHLSQDTREHVEDVQTDRSFLKTWNGKTWEQVAGVTPEQAGIEGVSGASMTSMAIAEAIMLRLRSTTDMAAQPRNTLRWRFEDIGLGLLTCLGTVLAFTGSHGRPWIRRGFQILVISYIGFWCAAPLAQSLFVGWTQSSAPWQTAPGLVLMAAAALALPWATGKPVYCQQLCPHGAAQELLSRLRPKRWKFALPKDVDAGLRWLPGLLLGLVLIVSFLVLPLDLASVEPFDAYSLRAAGTATLAIAAIGLIASCFLPMAYCHYGCPTGFLLTLVRSRGAADRFNRRDAAALTLLLLAQLLSANYHAIHAWALS